MRKLKQPCSDCPFRKNSLAGWLSGYTPEELHHIIMGEKPFPCHMTHKDGVQWEQVEQGEYPLCAGALRYMKKAAKMPRRPDLATAVASIKRRDCENILSIHEFFEHHKQVEPKS